MTNDELLSIKMAAEDLAQSFCALVLNGDGQFLDLTTVGPREVPASEVLRMFTQAERKAHALYLKLDAIPLTTRKPRAEQLALGHASSSGDA